jgi:hypothetical protein
LDATTDTKDTIMNSYPILFWIHSPVGYETYLAFKKTNPNIKIFCISVRNLNIQESILKIGLPGLFQLDQPDIQKKNILRISDALNKIIKEHGGYVLLSPQTAQPYIEMIIESDFCKGYAIYDEGTACYGVSFSEKLKPSFHKYKMPKTEEWVKASEILKFNLARIISKHELGVKFYDLTHEKFMGLFSFFENSFPGMEKIILDFPEDLLTIHNVAKNHSIVICGYLANIKDKSTVVETHFRNINNILSMSNNRSWVIKAHPNNNSEEIIKQVKTKCKTWEHFSDEFNIDPNRESAFMRFDMYLSQNNSTIQYLKNQGMNNYITIW